MYAIRSYYVEKAGCTLAMLKKGPFRLPEPMAPYLDKTFPTQSGKFECMTRFEPADLPTVDPSYPYALLTVAGFDHICSERTLMEHDQLPEILLHPAEAEKQGLRDGETVLLKSRIGQIKVRLHIDVITSYSIHYTKLYEWADVC